jgi:hypothetical protein
MRTHFHFHRPTHPGTNFWPAVLVLLSLGVVTGALGCSPTARPVAVLTSPSCSGCSADSEATWRPVQEQLDAYNAHDVDGFLKPYSDDVTIFRQPEGRIISHGRATMHDAYGKMFAGTPDLHCEVHGRLVSGEYVVDHEFVTMAHKSFDAVAIYHVTRVVARAPSDVASRSRIDGRADGHRDGRGSLCEGVVELAVDHAHRVVV